VVDTLLNTETALKEVFAEVVGWAMGQDTMWRIGDPCDAENLASARIMKKAPLRREGNPARWIIHPNFSSVPGTGSAVHGSRNNAHSRRWYFEPSLGLGRVIDPGAPALALQAPMGLLPGRRFGHFLQPVSDRSFIAPFHQPRHHATMCPGPHERAHRRLVDPNRASPEGQIGVAKHGNPKVSDRTPSLTRGAKGLDQECRQVAPRPHPKARDGDKRHGTGRWGLASISYQRPTNLRFLRGRERRSATRFS